MTIKKFRDIIDLIESKREHLKQEPLGFGRDQLAPVISKKTLDYHYGKLAKGYVDRYNRKEGNDEFNYGGAVLHNLFFTQLAEPRSGNRPDAAVAEIIDKKWKDFDSFKEGFALEFMKAQGSNWLYMDSTGSIHVIHNHEYDKSMDIILLFDGWEHSWCLDYEHDKQRYLDNFWRIVDWTVVNTRLQGANDD